MPVWEETRILFQQDLKLYAAKRFKAVASMCIQYRAGHFRYFFIFSIIKTFFSFFIKFSISAPVLFKKPTLSQINLTKKAKNHFLLLKK